MQEELLELPAVVGGLMSYASLVTCEGAMNALSREGCRHFEALDQVDEDFGRDIYEVEDPVVKESAGALYDRMWGSYGCEVVRARAEAARAQVTLSFARRLLDAVCAWVQEELLELPAVVGGLMSYASLVTCEGAMNALSREGCRHFEALDQVDEDFGRDIYEVEDPVVKESAGALYDRMWGSYGCEVVRARAEAARAQVTLSFARRLLDAVCARVC